MALATDLQEPHLKIFARKNWLWILPHTHKWPFESRRQFCFSTTLWSQHAVWHAGSQLDKWKILLCILREHVPELAKTGKPSCLRWLQISKDYYACGVSLSICIQAPTQKKGDNAFGKDDFKLMTEKYKSSCFRTITRGRKMLFERIYREKKKQMGRLVCSISVKVIFCFHRTDHVRGLF